MARKQGSIRKRGQSYQVRVYAGIDPVTGKENYLTASTPDDKEADRILRRFLTQVDNKRSARTKATFGDALDAWLRVHEADENTVAKLRKLHDYSAAMQTTGNGLRANQR